MDRPIVHLQLIKRSSRANERSGQGLWNHAQCKQRKISWKYKAKLKVVSKKKTANDIERKKEKERRKQQVQEENETKKGPNPVFDSNVKSDMNL